MESSDIVQLAKVVGGIFVGAFALWRLVLKFVVDKIGDAIKLFVEKIGAEMRELSSAIRQNTAVLNEGKVLAAKAEERDRELRNAIDRTTKEVRTLEGTVRGASCKFTPET